MLSRSSNVAIRAAARQYSRSIVVQQESSAAPKMHNATGNWASLKSKRPVDADDLHVSKKE